jgi:2-oxoglutarate ferredoxin oxidoreductase subunit delta
MIAGFARFPQGDSALLVNRDWCKGCNLCVAACPSGVLALDADQRVTVGDVRRCIFCGICAVRCPDFAILLDRPVPHVVEAPA